MSKDIISTCVFQPHHMHYSQGGVCDRTERTLFMAQKRMFDRAIIETDNFLNISLSAKALYFLLGMEADDEGFVSPNRVIRLYGGELGDIKNLVDVGLIIPFHSGVVVITHWNENNYLDKNRIKPTQYQKEKQELLLTGMKKYELNTCLTNVQPEERSIEEYRGEENSIEQNNNSLRSLSVSKKFVKPTLKEIKDYCSERRNKVDAENFFDHYESNGWKVGGRTSMKDWKASVRTWEKNNFNKSSNKGKSIAFID